MIIMMVINATALHYMMRQIMTAVHGEQFLFLMYITTLGVYTLVDYFRYI